MDNVDEMDLVGDAGRLDGVSLLEAGRANKNSRGVGLVGRVGQVGRVGRERKLSWEFYRGTPLRWWEVVTGAVILAVIVAGFCWAGMGAI